MLEDRGVKQATMPGVSLQVSKVYVLTHDLWGEVLQPKR